MMAFSRRVLNTSDSLIAKHMTHDHVILPVIYEVKEWKLSHLDFECGVTKMNYTVSHSLTCLVFLFQFVSMQMLMNLSSWAHVC